jgi:cell division protein FtsL
VTPAIDSAARQVAARPRVARPADAHPRPERERPDLRVVDAPQRERLRVARVGTIAGALLFVALFGLAAFQTVLIRAQDRLDDLNRDVEAQSELDEQLRLELADLRSPERVAQVARDRLGMIAPHTVTFLEPTPSDDVHATYLAPPSTTTPSTTTR